MTELPIVYVDMSVEQMKIATLRHNRARGNEDYALVRNIMQDLKQLDALEWAKDSLMLDDTEMTNILSGLSAADGLGGENFTNSWEPGVMVNDSNKGNAEVFVGDDIKEQRKQIDKKLSKTKNIEERMRIRKSEPKFKSVQFMLSESDYEVVRHVLGKDPVQMLLKLCKEKKKLDERKSKG